MPYMSQRAAPATKPALSSIAPRSTRCFPPVCRWIARSRPKQHPPKSGAHYSPDDCPTDTPRHRRSPSSNRPLRRRNRPIGITAGNRRIWQCGHLPSRLRRKRPSAPLRHPVGARMTAGWTMAAERRAARTSRRSATRGNLGKEAGWSVEFDIDRSLRVSDAEVQVLETWLGRQLDALFGGADLPRNGAAAPDEAMKIPKRK